MTLRDLADASDNHCSLQEWLDIAQFAGLAVTADTVLDSMQVYTLRKTAPAFFAKKKQEEAAAERETEKRKAASEEMLEKLIQENYIFVDISSLLEPAGERALMLMLPLLKKYGKKLYISYSVLREMTEGASDQSDPKRAELCGQRTGALKKLQEMGLVDIRDFSKDDNPARDLMTACAHFRITNPLLVITQDKKLAEDLVRLNYQKAANGKSITVKRVNKYGYLSNLIARQGKAFYVCDKVRETPDCQIPVTFIPKTGDCVYGQPECKDEISLCEEIGSGGEGTIYQTNTPYVAKIYKEECCTAYRLEKLLRMIEAKLEYNGICFPVSVLYNRKSEFVGYLMMKAKGYSVQQSIFRKSLFLKKFPGWKKEDLVQCAITILFKYKYLHDHNILVGDINPNNILVASPLEVYLVDTDSFQINDLPCPVGFPLFTAPELHQKHRNGELHGYGEIMRTKSNECFAVATLMFMMMLPGKPPYTQQGGEDIVDNILQMHFPYPLDERHGENVPDGTWKYIWSNLTHRMKDNFHTVFDGIEGKSVFNIEERLTVDQWIMEMREYQRILEHWTKEFQNNPGSSEVDPESLKLYPERLKRQRGVKYDKCRGGCGREFPEERLKAGYCSECQRKGEELKCIVCGERFVYTNYEKYFKKFRRPLMCPKCRSKKDEVFKRYQCQTPGCFNDVEVTYGNYAYLKSNNYQLPKYCQICRDLRERKAKKAVYKGTKQEKAIPQTPVKPTRKAESQTPVKPTERKASSGQAGCFITTAVCGYLGKPDDCQELTDFRFFRDNWLRLQPGGERQVQEYYDTAPELVRRMHDSSEYGQICGRLWTDFLVPCHEMIRHQRFEECRARYEAMVKYLRNVLAQ